MTSLEKGQSGHAPFSCHHANYFAVLRIMPWKRAITPTGAGPLNNKIQVYAPHILKCLHEMQIIRFMHVCISLFHHQIKIYKQSGQKKWIAISILSITPTGIYLCKVNNGKTRTTCKISSKLVIKTSACSQWRNRTDHKLNCHLVL